MHLAEAHTRVLCQVTERPFAPRQFRIEQRSQHPFCLGREQCRRSSFLVKRIREAFAVNVNLSEYIWVRGLRTGLPANWFIREIFGIVLVLIYVFAEILGWLPPSGIRPAGASGWNPLEMAPYLVLPALVLATGMIASLTRYTRSGMLETIHQDYVRTARAKGLGERRVIVGHALRNSLITVVTLLGVLTPILLSGSVVVESVFALPGMGRLAVGAAVGRDYPVVMTVNLLAATLVLVFNLLTDVAYSIVDPRIRVHE